MVSILLVTPAETDGGSVTAPEPSVEILHAHGLEDCLEKLGRNRRIDAVLLAAGPDIPEIVQAIREDNPAPPPLFAPEGQGAAVAGLRFLPADSLPRLLEMLLSELT